MKDENGNVLEERHAYTAESYVREPNSFAAEIANEKAERYKSPCIDQILAELIQAGGNILRSEIHRLNNSVCNTEELPQQWKESIIVHIYEESDKTDCSNCRGISLLPTTYKFCSKFLSQC
jgi:hypothetical protein